MTTEPAATAIAEWNDGKVAFLSRIAATTGTLKIVLKTKDDHHLLERWIIHHARIVGFENLVILDNMSSDARVLRIYEKYRTRVPLIRFRRNFDSVHVGDRWPALYKCLTASCEFFSFLDTDEFLVHLRDDAYICDRRILDILHSRREADVLPGTWLTNVPGFDRRFRTASYVADFAPWLAWGKPIVRSSSFELERDRFENHSAQHRASAYRGRIWLDFFVAHLKNLSVQQRIEVNINKLVALKSAAPGDTLASIVSRDLDSFTTYHTRELAAELRALASQADGQPRDITDADCSWLELAPRGRVVYSGKAQAHAMRVFQDHSEPICRAILQTDSINLERHPDVYWPRFGRMFASNRTPAFVPRAGRPPVCVAGLTGTESSAVARILGVAGLRIGEPSDFPVAAAAAPLDPWQDSRFVAINEQILEAAGGGWDRPPVVPARWNTDPRFVSLTDAAEALLGEFAAVPSWGWQDSLNSLTVPFWQALAGAVKVIVCLRHPLDVAESLHARHGLSAAVGLSLWKTYMERAIADTRPVDRLVTHDEALVDDPAFEVRRLLDFAGLDAADETREACRLAIDARSTPEPAALAGDGADLAPDIAALYRALLIEAGRPPALSRRRERDRTVSSVSAAGVAGKTRELRTALEAQALVLSALDAEVARPRRRLEELEASIDSRKRLNDRLDAAMKPGATVLVVSQGDEALVSLSGSWRLHFPHTPDGVWNGNPASSEDAIAQLDAIRAAGPVYLVLPEKSRWWLTHYSELTAYLCERCRTVFDDDATAIVFELDAPGR